MNYPQKLLEEIRLGNVIPFIGSGVSIPSGFPSWGKLINEVINLIEDESIKKSLQTKFSDGTLTSLETPEFVKLVEGNFSLKEHLGRVFRQPASTNIFHKLIQQIPTNVYVTTNYDTLLEDMCKENGVQYKLIWRDEQLLYFNEKAESQIIKMHGDAQNVDSIVFSKIEYDNYIQENSLLYCFIASLFVSRTFLFLGFSLNDPNIKGLLRKIKSDKTGISPNHYAVLHKPQPDVVSTLKELGIKVIKIEGENRTESLSHWLQGLIDNSVEQGKSNLEKAILINSSLNEFLSKLSYGNKIRMRASLGIISNPEKLTIDNIYGSKEQDEQELEMGNYLRAFLQKNEDNVYKTIIHVDKIIQLRNGYSSKQLKERISAMLEFIQEYPNQILVAHSTSPVMLNHLIVGTECSFTTYKSGYQVGYKRTVKVNNKWIVNSEIENFDNDFDSILALNKSQATTVGIDISNQNWSIEFNKLILNQILSELNTKDLVYVCDINGNLLQLEDKSKVHKEGILHKSIHLCILSIDEEDKINLLIQKRSKSKSLYSEKFDLSVCGHQTENDSIKEMIRESLEELRLKLTYDELVKIDSYNRSVKSDEFIDNEVVEMFYTIVEHNRVSLNNFNDEVEGLYWVPFDGLIKENQATGRGKTKINGVYVDTTISLNSSEFINTAIHELKTYYLPKITEIG